MSDHTPHQKKIIDRYYANRDSIMLEKLAGLVGELYLAESDKKREQLWKRVETALKNLKVPASLAGHILEAKDPKLLARHLKDWLEQP